MELNYRLQENGIRLLSLTGQMDIIGTSTIETKFAGYCAVNNAIILVDLSEVPFLASIGIRLLVFTAKAVSARGGKMGIVGPNERVQEILDITGIPNIIPIFSSLEEAEKIMLTP